VLKLYVFFLLSHFLVKSYNIDGNCLLSAVVKYLSENEKDIDVAALRRKLVEHLRSEKAHYKNFVASVSAIFEDIASKCCCFPLSFQGPDLCSFSTCLLCAAWTVLLFFPRFFLILFPA
jgi:hypothetical protein